MILCQAILVGKLLVIKFDKNMKSKHKENKSKRYYLHSVVRKQGYNLNSLTKTIIIPHSEVEKSLSRHAYRLVTEFGYNLQTTII